MSRQDPQIKLRLPQDLKEQIEEAAKISNRSMNAEVVSRLAESFTPPNFGHHLNLNICGDADTKLTHIKIALQLVREYLDKYSEDGFVFSFDLDGENIAVTNGHGHSHSIK